MDLWSLEVDVLLLEPKREQLRNLFSNIMVIKKGHEKCKIRLDHEID